MRRPASFVLAALFVAGCQRPSERDVDTGNALAAQGKLVAARDAYAAAVAADPQAARPRALLGEVELALGHSDQAGQAFEAALAMSAADTVALVGAAQLAVETADAGAALSLLGHLAPGAGAAPEARLVRARALLLLGGAQSAQLALGEAEAARAARPQDPVAAYVVGSCQIALGKLSDAQATFDALERAHPASAFGPYGLARLAAAQGRATDALLHLKAARASKGPWRAQRVALDPAFAFLSGDPAFLELTKTSP